MSQTGWYSPRVGSRKVRSSRSAKLNSKFETSLVYIILWVDPQNEILYTFYFWYKAFCTVVNSPCSRCEFGGGTLPVVCAGSGNSGPLHIPSIYLIMLEVTVNG